MLTRTPSHSCKNMNPQEIVIKDQQKKFSSFVICFYGCVHTNTNKQKKTACVNKIVCSGIKPGPFMEAGRGNIIFEGRRKLFRCGWGRLRPWRNSDRQIGLQSEGLNKKEGMTNKTSRLWSQALIYFFPFFLFIFPTDPPSLSLFFFTEGKLGLSLDLLKLGLICNAPFTLRVSSRFVI